MDGVTGRWVASIFAMLNAGLLLYAIHRFIGFPESYDDFTFRMTSPGQRTGILVHSEATFSAGSASEAALGDSTGLPARNE